MSDNITLVLLGWIILAFAIARHQRGPGSAGTGLVLAYVLNFFLLFWIPGALYMIPWYQGALREPTVLGTVQSFWGIAGFAAGSLLIAPAILKTGILPEGKTFHRADLRLPVAYLLAGCISYAALAVFWGRLPSLNSILSAGEELVIVGLSLCCWQAWRNGGTRRAIPWVAASFCFPIVTVVLGGYIGYGAVASLTVLIFFSNFVRSRAKVLVVGVLLGYFALSVYVTYMRDRSEIRKSVWGGQALSDRIGRVVDTASRFEWLDLNNDEHLSRLDERLNQSSLTGYAVIRMTDSDQFAHGETFWDAFLALVPRIFWPDKPFTAGSGNLVARFTGLRFDKSTSVGIGQLMEFYVNFGTPGVLFGFAAFGVIITILDVLATDRLAKADLRGFVLFYLPGIAFLQVGGQLAEITASAAASLVVAFVVNRLVDRLQQTQAQSPVQVAVAQSR